MPSSSKTNEEEVMTIQNEKRRNLIAFFLLGLLNNCTYVLLNAGAGDIVPGEYAVIYLCNIVPSLIVKLTGPYWFHYLTYKQRIVTAGMCVALCYVLVNHVETKAIRLLGVALGAIQGGLGEATYVFFIGFHTHISSINYKFNLHICISVVSLYH